MQPRLKYVFAILGCLLLAGSPGGCSSDDSPAAAPQVEPPLKIVLRLPEGASEVTQTGNKVEFALPGGTAKAAIEAWQELLATEGWSQNESAHSELTGRVFLTRDLQGLTITYLDGETLPADVIVQAKGADLVVVPVEPVTSEK